MREHDSPKTYGELEPEAALSLLGNEVRAAVLWTLSEARGGGGPPPVLSFSELRERSAASIDSSQFNYHLQTLVGTFVERIDDSQAENPGEYENRPVPEMAGWPGEGYRLTPEGTTLVRTVRAWSFPGDAVREPFELDRACYHCGETLRARYRNAIFAIQCPGCEYVYDYNLTPPGVLGDDQEAVLERVAEYNRHIRLGFARGVCPYCANDVDAAFLDPEQTGYPRGDLREVLIRRGCDHCGNMDYLTAGETLLRDAGLVAFCHERGLDVTTTSLWDLPFAATDRHTTVRSTDPWEVAVAVEREGNRLELVLDENLDVAERIHT